MHISMPCLAICVDPTGWLVCVMEDQYDSRKKTELAVSPAYVFPPSDAFNYRRIWVAEFVSSFLLIIAGSHISLTYV